MSRILLALQTSWEPQSRVSKTSSEQEGGQECQRESYFTSACIGELLEEPNSESLRDCPLQGELAIDPRIRNKKGELLGWTSAGGHMKGKLGRGKLSQNSLYVAAAAEIEEHCCL